jgi:photosystem II stability/assembly factor-like uncharacterized protein
MRYIRRAGLTLVALVGIMVLIAQPAAATYLQLAGHGSPPPRRHGLQGFQPASMSFVDDNTGYLLGYAQATGIADARFGGVTLLARTDNGGVTWRRVPAPTVQTVNDGAATVHFLTPDVGFVKGRRTYLTTDGAAHWQRVDPALRIVDLDEAAGEVWALAHPCRACHGLRVYSGPLSDARLRRASDAPQFRYGGARFIHGSGDEIYIVTSSKEHRGRILRSYRGGPWTTQREPCASFGNFTAWSDAGLAAVCNVILFGAGNETKRAYVSFDGAHTWTRRGAPGEFGYLGGLAAGTSDSWVLAESRGGFITTTDDGARWSYAPLRVGIAEGVGDTQFTSADRVVAIPDYMPDRVFMSSRDAGQHWAVYRFPKWPRHRERPGAPAD